MIEEQRRLR
jgi:hypothetical protein